VVGRRWALLAFEKAPGYAVMGSSDLRNMIGNTGRTTNARDHQSRAIVKAKTYVPYQGAVVRQQFLLVPFPGSNSLSDRSFLPCYWADKRYYGVMIQR
jgi:hypothetical protein